MTHLLVCYGRKRSQVKSSTFKVGLLSLTLLAGYQVVDKISKWQHGCVQHDHILYLRIIICYRSFLSR